MEEDTIDNPDEDTVDDLQDISSFLVIGRDTNENTFQYDFSKESQSGELKNITDQTPPFFNAVNFKENLLSFYQLQSLWIKDINTNNIITRENFFDPSDGESVFLNENSGSTIFTAYEKPLISNDLYIRAEDIATSTEVDILIGKADWVYGLLYSQNRLIIAYSLTENLDTSHYVSVLNTIDNTIVKTLKFDSQVQFISTDNSGNLFLRHGFSFTFGLYTLNDMELTKEYTIEAGIEGIDYGLYKENSVYYLQPLAQPGPYAYYPAVYNLETKTNKVIDFFVAFNDYKSNNNIAGISIIDSVFDFDKNTVLISTYLTYADQTFKAGIFEFDIDGNMLSDIIIDEAFSPLYIFLK
ncbi:hypothetical protein GCM10009430_33820 [Aquimarina litoralis]|uniref:TolB-like 6-blade propeller-like n=2 Tax=Aquimarina litoralis TaxID=584605 RepID=A0ABP3U827_9FLAO